VVLHGRESEQAAIGALLSDARAGAGGSLVLLGEPGAGKSVLLADAARATHDMTVLRTAGIESEAPLAFAALHRLLRPLMRLVDRLPEPQAHALRVAFGQEVGGGSDRFLVFLGALSLLAEAAEERPVLAVVDDAHWLDEASAAALLFIGRRVQVEAVAMLFAARENDVRTFESADLPSLRLRGLGLDAVSALLGEHSRTEVSAEVSAQLLASTGGNPLALVELPEVLSAEQLRGDAPLPGRLPVTAGVERVFLDRARRLSPEAQRFLLVAAADDSTRVATVLQAAGRMGVARDVLTEVERSGLVSVVDEHLVMRHPLVRSALYTAATTADRRAAHAALAQTLSREEDADRRAWHRSAAAIEPDEAVVDDLVDAAQRAQRRGGHEAAAAAWERAAELTTGEEARGERLYHAARAAWLAGRPRRARELADAARASARDPLLLADIVRLRARVEWNTGSVRLGHRMILEAAREVAPHDAVRAREMATFGMAIAAFGGDSGVGIDPVAFAAPPPAAAPARDRCFAELLLGLHHVVAGDWPRAGQLLRQAFTTALELGEEDQDLLPNLGIAALHMGDQDLSEHYHDRLLTRARSSGAVVMVLYSLTRLVFSDLPEGQWSTAIGRATEALTLGEETRQPVLAGMPRAWLLLVAALRGEDSFDARAADLEQVTNAHSMGILDVLLRDVTRWAKGVQSMTRPASAFHHLAQISHDIIKRMAAIDRLESAVRAEQPEAAALWIEDLDVFADGTGQVWAAAAAEHGRALLADDQGAETHFKRALDLHSNINRPFDRARTELAYGEHLRRARRRIDAREQLRSALETFQDLQARPWAERASQELRASGETARKRDVSTTAALTPQELQVAQLVRQGMSNRDVASQLFVSPRTVDFHLRNVFAKTGVTSRVELAALALG
jgi:DNA-binding CsgD family transcriptional regulator